MFSGFLSGEMRVDKHTKVAYNIKIMGYYGLISNPDIQVKSMKVLLISHNPISSQNNMGKTFLSLFSQFQKEELCQLYIYPTLPNLDRCAAYYRITDKEVLASFLRGKRPGGELDKSLIGSEQGMYENPQDQSFYKNRKNKSALRRLLRDAMWSMSGWYGPELEDWLERQKPECIFVAPGPGKFLYNFALEIGKKRNIPIVTYLCDEYYFVRTPRQLLDRLRLRSLQRKIRRLMDASSHLVVISGQLQRAYAKTFGVPTDILMTGTSYEFAPDVRETAPPEHISYFGNIRCNRYISLAQIGRTLDRINGERGTDYRLKIYTAEKDPEILNTFSGIESVEICGFLTGEAFDKTFQSSQLLLHVEAFDEASMDFVKHSISTKIADSLASGIPLLAYGPESVASMEHLLDNGCALTATAEDRLEEMLLSAFTDADARQQAARRALEVARQYHDSEATGRKLYRILTQVAGREN